MDTNRRTKLVRVAAAALVLSGLLVVASGLLETNLALAIGRARVQAEYDEKIIYSQSLIGVESAIRAHCSAQGGEFKTCGKSCAPGAEFCSAMCTPVCEFNSQQLLVRIGE